ncbi:HAD-IIB family hydrolase [uncultured Methylophaga sp.]|uniref:HAD-IIB family hydrolase n=1 Tax=uncultured Methylophaga sp. TaxID=285271 RepID=UPI00262BB9E7|nr:HAD-IIB family hydrolase [uncultured Methylophaga sp.]
MLDTDITGFLRQQQLPDSYRGLIKEWFAPLSETIKSHHNSAKRPLIVGINGAQGSGKSTLAACLQFLLEQQGLRAVTLSLDDFYFTRNERQTLASGIHPLLATRGVPGTHDIALARKTLSDLLHRHLPVFVPRFNKATDDRSPPEFASCINEPVDIILLEGWCLGATAEDEAALSQAVNDLEANEDSDGHWRRYVNEQLARFYPALFDLIDIWIMLKAPSFDCIYNWRLEQENKLRQNAQQQSQVMDELQLSRFIKFYQRITENTLNTLPERVHYLFELNASRQITKLTSRPPKLSAMKDKQWLIFTDMDGSLLDHHNYHFDDAVPTLKALASVHIPVMPVTSKTQAEVELLRDSLNNAHPFIVENGAAVFIPVGYFEKQPEDTVEKDGYWIKAFVEPRKKWQQLIEQLRPRYAGEFKTFTDAGIDGIIAMTGLNVHAAARAARRQFGEPIAWQGNGNLKQQFIEELQQAGAHILEGGRFMHVSGDCNKGRALRWLTQIFQAAELDKTMLSLAIGDSQNDQAMLEQADYALLIRSPVHPLPTVNREQNLTISTHTGPKGWAEGVNQILDATLHPDSSTQPRGNHG